MSRRLRDPESAAAVFLLTALAFVALALIGGVFLGRATKSSTTVTVSVSTTPGSTQTVDPKVAAGAHDFVNFACAQCHGLDGRGGVSPYVPALKRREHADRRPAAARSSTTALGVSANPTHPYMPVWGQVISTRQVDDLVAYIHAGLPKVPTATPVTVPTRTGRGRRRARRCTRSTAASTATARTGSAACRTRSRPTRRSRRSRGPTSSSEFNTDAKIRDVIVSGSVLGKAPIVSMPHWGGIIPPTRLDALVAYIKTLKTS